MPSFVPTESRQGADYRSNLHVPGMDAVPDSEVFEGDAFMGDQSFSTFGKEPLHTYQHQQHLQASTLDTRELHALLSNSRTPYKANYLCEYPRTGRAQSAHSFSLSLRLFLSSFPSLYPTCSELNLVPRSSSCNLWREVLFDFPCLPALPPSSITSIHFLLISAVGMCCFYTRSFYHHHHHRVNVKLFQFIHLS